MLHIISIVVWKWTLSCGFHLQRRILNSLFLVQGTCHIWTHCHSWVLWQCSCRSGGRCEFANAQHNQLADCQLSTCWSLIYCILCSIHCLRLRSPFLAVWWGLVQNRSISSYRDSVCQYLHFSSNVAWSIFNCRPSLQFHLYSKKDKHVLGNRYCLGIYFSNHFNFL